MTNCTLKTKIQNKVRGVLFWKHHALDIFLLLKLPNSDKHLKIAFL